MGKQTRKRRRRYNALPRVLALLEQCYHRATQAKDTFKLIEQLVYAHALCELIDATEIPPDQILNIRALLIRCQSLPDLTDIAAQTLKQLTQPLGRQPLPRALVHLICNHSHHMSEAKGFSRLGYVGRFSFLCQVIEQIKLSPAERQSAIKQLRDIENTAHVVGLAPTLRETIKNLEADA